MVRNLNSLSENSSVENSSPEGPKNIVDVIPLTGAFTYSPAEFENIKRRERFSAKAYWDFKGYSIGYGHFITPNDGVGAGRDWVIDNDTAIQLLRADADTAAAAVNSALTVPVSQNQFDALFDLAYNIGAGAFTKSTLVRRINAGDPNASESFLDWVKVTVGGIRKTSAALSQRREENKQVFDL